jgi:transposase
VPGQKLPQQSGRAHHRGTPTGPGSHPGAEIGSLTERIKDYDRKLQQICQERYPQTALLRQVAGIGPLTAVTFVLTVEDPYRFEKSRSVGAYLGLVPATARSGDRDPHKRISKEGDEMLRKLVVGSAHYILGPFGSDSDLRRHGEKIASRGARTPRSGRWLPWRESSRCYYTACGSTRKSTSHCATPTAQEPRQLKGSIEAEAVKTKKKGR